MMSKAWGLFVARRNRRRCWHGRSVFSFTPAERITRLGFAAIVAERIALRSTSVIVVGLHLATVFADEADLALCLQDSPGDLIHVGDAR